VAPVPAGSIPVRLREAVVGVRLILTTDFFTPVVDDAYD